MQASDPGSEEERWSDLEAAVATEQGQEAMAMLVEDESTFIDFRRSTVFMTEEHEVFDRAPA